AFYYLRVIKLMYMDEPADNSPLIAETDHRVLVGLNGLAILVFGIVPQPLIDLCMVSISQSMR
ncbi:MAG: NADH:ubiquinone oxidoreductase subunit N, partial [Betaproteobacteria bacterium]|nr:NADH:ubiquinone oxidoreductase subunit N [Betaproteobacteria bacterium]